MRRRYNVAIVGATGVVGQQMLRVLEQRRFPIARVRLLASPRSVGRHLAFNGSRCRVEVLSRRAFDGIDLALFSAGASRSRQFAPEAVRRGALVVDNSSAFRLDPRVPLIVPEINPQALTRHAGLVANPNCSTMIMLMALAPLHAAATLTRVIVATYQSVSGAGAKAMEQLLRETRRLTQGRGKREGGRGNWAACGQRRIRSQGPLPAQIAFNVIPQVDLFLANRSTREEVKMAEETRKILAAPDPGGASKSARKRDASSLQSSTFDFTKSSGVAPSEKV